MFPSGLSTLAVFGTLSVYIASVQAQATFPATPLVSKTGFTYPSGVPYKVDTDTNLLRGAQTGYNLCNSTTEGQSSLCQTAVVNSLDDFCLWGPKDANSSVANTEGEMVAWCSKSGHGSRIFPDGALKGVQFIKTPDYVLVAGFIDQEKINIAKGDSGGEMDPHGADLRGNPLGSLLFSNSYDGSYKQVIEWHNFMGADIFCIKACDPAKPNAANFCEHKLDRIGCAFNAPNQARMGVFETCDGENQDYPGTYTENGQVMTYTQPPESLGAITSMPYTARVPKSSNCVEKKSEEIYKAVVTSAPNASPSGGVNGNVAAATTSGGANGNKASSTASGANARKTNGAMTVTGVFTSTLPIFAGVALSVVFLL